MKKPGLTAPEMERQELRATPRKSSCPSNVAGYITKGDDNKPVNRYAAIWVKTAEGDDARMCVGKTPSEVLSIRDDFKEQERSPPHPPCPATARWQHEGEQRAGADHRPKGRPPEADGDLVGPDLAAMRVKRSGDELPESIYSIGETDRSRPWRRAQVRATRKDLAATTLQGQAPQSRGPEKIAHPGKSESSTTRRKTLERPENPDRRGHSGDRNPPRPGRGGRGTHGQTNLAREEA